MAKSNVAPLKLASPVPESDARYIKDLLVPLILMLAPFDRDPESSRTWLTDELVGSDGHLTKAGERWLPSLVPACANALDVLRMDDPARLELGVYARAQALIIAIEAVATQRSDLELHSDVVSILGNLHDAAKVFFLDI